MASVVSEKICIDCKKPYKPTANAQKRCPNCMRIPSRAKSATTDRVLKPRNPAAASDDGQRPAKEGTESTNSTIWAHAERLLSATQCDTIVLRKGNIQAVLSVLPDAK